MALLYSLILFVLMAGVAVNFATATSERDLRRDIFQGYDKLVRPVKKYSSTVTVFTSITPLAIRSMSLQEHILVLETWMMMKWTDEYLRWDPEEYDNITELRISPGEIWRPDLALYTGTPDMSLFPVIRTQAVLYNTGTVLWVPPFTIKSRCPQPNRNYVTERSFVECNIRIGSWTYNAKLMDLQLLNDKVDLTDFQDFNTEWKLVKIVSNRESKKYPCCPNDFYPHVNFNVTLKRRNNYINN